MANLKSNNKELPENKEEQVKYLVETTLKDLEKLTPENTMSASEIYDFINEKHKPDILPSTFKVYLSKLVNSEDSHVNRQPKKRGYYLAPNIPEIAKDEEKQEIVKDRTEKESREKKLYKIFTNWLFAQKYVKVKDTSNSKNQDLGSWGNPDIVGLKQHEIMGKVVDLEFTTIEVKATMNNWKYFIFEAVAHKRFSNRVYFAFTYPEDFPNKIDPDIKHYAELYGVGILALPVSDEIFSYFEGKKSKLTSHQVSEQIESLADTDIIELASAPYMPTNYHFRKKFMEALKITSETTLQNWGESNPTGK